MTAAIRAGALSRVDLNWVAIDWHSAHRVVRRLQARIVKATQEQRWGKVKALQHLITHSFSVRIQRLRRRHRRRWTGPHHMEHPLLHRKTSPPRLAVAKEHHIAYPNSGLQTRQ
jgi:reverse transcriptase-like protein